MGQIDYAAANEVLNKMARREAARRPGCRAVSFNWGPWAGGMVDPALEKVFLEEGLALLPLSEGARHMVDELGRVGPVEVVVLGAGSHLPAEAGVIAASAAQDAEWTPKTLSVQTHPILTAHVLAGRAVLPLAWMMDWLAEAARAGQSLDFQGFDDFRVHRRLALDPGQTLVVHLAAGPARPEGGGMVRPVRLEAERPDEPVIAEGRAVLARDRDSGPPAVDPGELTPYPHNDRIYENGRLFHGPALQVIKRIDGLGPRGIAGRITAGDAAGPVDPFALDAVFQMIVLWCQENHGRPALPIRVARYRTTGASFPARTELRIQIRVTGADGPMIEADAEIIAPDGRAAARVEGAFLFESEGLVQEYLQNRLTDALAAPAAADQALDGFWPTGG
jgi:hypothetical protein